MFGLLAAVDWIVRLAVKILPRGWQRRIQYNASTTNVFVLRTEQSRTKPRMTFVEAVFATLLFDLALFGTDNFLINVIIRAFTNFQNAWDKAFASSEEATSEITAFCQQFRIQQDPWIWSKPMEEYTSLNDFFSRYYATPHMPPLATSDIVSPACCTFSVFQDNEGMQRLLVKGCDYQFGKVGLYPADQLQEYAKHHVILGYLSPTDYHRFHAPISGNCVYCQMQDELAPSASVKFFGGRFNLLNNNKRLIFVFEHATKQGVYVSLVMVGGIGVNTIVYDKTIVGQQIVKGQDLGTFRAGGSAFVMFSNHPLTLDSKIPTTGSSSASGDSSADKEMQQQQPIEVLVGESLASFQ